MLDVVGVFGYSDEDGTEAAGLEGKHDAETVAARLRVTSDLVAELTDQRAEDRVGEQVVVLVEELDDDGVPVGRAAHQGPDVDGTTALVGPGAPQLAVGDIVTAVVTGTQGVDLLAEPVPA